MASALSGASRIVRATAEYREFLARQAAPFHQQRLYPMADQLPRLTLQLLTCWARVLPDIQIIGAQKAGTTSVQAMLVQHPDVRAGLAKESHFFDGRSIFGALDYPSSWLPWLYRAFFPGVGRSAWHRLVRGRPLRVVDATPVTMMLERAPALLRALTPRAKLIAVLRDPVDRAWSHYRMNLRWGREHRPFADALVAEELLWSDARGEAELSEAHWNASYFRRGWYATQLRRVRAAGFPTDQLLLVDFDELRARPHEVAARLFAFLELRACPVTVGARNVDPTPRSAARAAAEGVLEQLRARYTDELETLAREFAFPAALRWIAPGPVDACPSSASAARTS